MTIDATFWVMISFFAFVGLLIYFKIPQKIKRTLDENIENIKIQLGKSYEQKKKYDKIDQTGLKLEKNLLQISIRP